MTDPSARAWIVEHLGESVFERLASGLAGSELQSVLLELICFVLLGSQLIALRFRASERP